MSDLSNANYAFLPYVRQGAAAGIQTPDGLGAPPPPETAPKPQPGVVSVSVSLQVNDVAPVTRNLRLYGPGDVTGIDPQQVIRTEPANLAADFEPNYFPLVEFDRPDFPWLFTPAAAGADGKLRPWLCLVTVRKQKGVTLTTDRSRLLPVLEIDASVPPQAELPDLSESWAWAHAQVLGTTLARADLKAALLGNPALTLSRLISPRRLDPFTEYLACVVPTFELGRKAGLGLPFAAGEEAKLDPAWQFGAGAPSALTLPVYYHWEFRTGAGDDFEALADKLEPRPVPAAAGKRPMDISRPGFAAPGLPPDLTLPLEGALRAFGASPGEWPDDQTRLKFEDPLRNILNAPWQAAQDGLTDGAEEPLLGPPIYGCWQASQNTVEIVPQPPAAPPAPAWLHELNLDPRHRAAAGLGTLVVQDQQEQLVAAAWEQMGEIQRINQVKRQAQLGRAVNGVFHARHLSAFGDATLLQVVAPAQSRLVLAVPGPDGAAALGQTTTRTLLSRTISLSALPDRAVSAPLRRMTSTQSAVMARFQPRGSQPITILSVLNSDTPLVPAQRRAAGWVTLDQVSDQAAGGMNQSIRFAQITHALDAAPPLSDFNIIAEGTLRSLPNFTPVPAGPSGKPTLDQRQFLAAAKDLQEYLDEKVFSPATNQLAAGGRSLDMAATRSAVLKSISPDQTIAARVGASVKIAGDARPADDPLDPVVDGPAFPQPMYEALRDLSQDYLFPGLDQVLPNTAALLETNPTFVESFLVGLNAEMGRELLWRGFPTDQRGTYFRQFWDSLAPDAQGDIAAINEWENTKLGENARGGEKLVLLLRGELLRRYPNAVIYAVPAVRDGQQLTLSPDAQAEIHPVFRGTLKPDVTFLGFPIQPDDATGDPGMFFVIQEQPTEPRFGLDEAKFGADLPALTGWDQLSWGHLAHSPEELIALSYVSIAAGPGKEFDHVAWGKNAAHQARITLQRPVRVAIHASQLIPKG
ncbi:MAG: hypothetical protein U0X20_29490 [Caldilineaceae bacterium]